MGRWWFVFVDIRGTEGWEFCNVFAGAGAGVGVVVVAVGWRGSYNVGFTNF